MSQARSSPWLVSFTVHLLFSSSAWAIGRYEPQGMVAILRWSPILLCESVALFVHYPLANDEVDLLLFSVSEQGCFK